MRRRVALSKRFRSHGLVQLKTDVRDPTRFNGHGQIASLVVLRVGEICLLARRKVWKLLNRYCAPSGKGAGKLTERAPIEFTGLLNERLADGSIALPHPQYPTEQRKMGDGSCIENNRILGSAKFRKALRHCHGALIWLHQKRSDIGHDITKLATDAWGAVASVIL